MAHVRTASVCLRIGMFGMVGAAGCAGELGSEPQPGVALSSPAVSAPHLLSVPSYFSPSASADWNQLATDGSPGRVSFAIVNVGHSRSASELKANGTPVAGGPGITANATLRDVVIPQLHAAGILVLGYTYYRFQRDTQRIEEDITAWDEDYHADGIFFDVAARSGEQGGVGRVQYWTDRVKTRLGTSANGGLGYSLFNWGGITFRAEEFVRCGVKAGGDRVLFVTAENFADAYTDGEAFAEVWSAVMPWIRQFRPWHFVHLIHDAPLLPQPDLDARLRKMMVTAAARNAQHVYITDQSYDSNPWQFLAEHGSSAPQQFDLFRRQQAKAGESYSFDGSASDPPPPADCKPVSSEEAGSDT